MLEANDPSFGAWVLEQNGIEDVETGSINLYLISNRTLPNALLCYICLLQKIYVSKEAKMTISIQSVSHFIICTIVDNVNF